MYDNDLNQDLTYVERNPEVPMPEDNGKKKHKKEKKPGKGTGRSALNGLVFGLCAALIFCGVVAVGNRTFLKPAQQETVASAETAETTDATDKKADIPNTTTGTAQTVSQAGTGYSVSDIAKNCMPSIVAITTKGIEEVRSMFGTQQRESEGAGSGIIVGKNDTELLIATNNHVVSGAEEVSVCFDDSEDSVVSAKVKGTDSSNDLAIVSVALSDISDDILSNIKIATIGDSSSVQVGDQVVARLQPDVLRVGQGDVAGGIRNRLHQRNQRILLQGVFGVVEGRKYIVRDIHRRPGWPGGTRSPGFSRSSCRTGRASGSGRASGTSGTSGSVIWPGGVQRGTVRAVRTVPVAIEHDGSSFPDSHIPFYSGWEKGIHTEKQLITQNKKAPVQIPTLF